MPKCYVYLRVSHDDSAASGLSMEHQRLISKKYFELLKERASLVDLEWGEERFPEFGDERQPAGCFYDAAVSAYTKTFMSRPAGRKLIQVLEPGDHIIVARMDRGFRNLEDQLSTLRLFDKRKISLHFAQEMCDMSTAHGRLTMQFHGAIAEWYPAYIGERTREAFRIKRASGKKHVSPRSYGYGFKGVLIKGKWRMHTNMEQWWRLKRVLVMRCRRGMSWQDIDNDYRKRWYRQCKIERRAKPWPKIPTKYRRDQLAVMYKHKWINRFIAHQKACLALCYVGDPDDPANWGWDAVVPAYRAWLGYKNPVPTV